MIIQIVAGTWLSVFNDAHNKGGGESVGRSQFFWGGGQFFQKQLLTASNFNFMYDLIKKGSDFYEKFSWKTFCFYGPYSQLFMVHPLSPIMKICLNTLNILQQLSEEPEVAGFKTKSAG